MSETDLILIVHASLNYGYGADLCWHVMLHVGDVTGFLHVLLRAQTVEWANPSLTKPAFVSL